MSMPKTALVTGAAVRIGRAIAEGLAADGWAVALHHRHSADEARAAVKAIEAAGGKAVALQAALDDEAQSGALVPRAIEALGSLGCLVNSAAVFEHDDVASATRASWDLHLETNLRAPFVLSQAFAKALPRDAQGAIINLVDQRVWSLTPQFICYTLSKAGLWTLTQTMALALAPRIRVNAIGPGPVLPSPRQTQEQFVAQSRRTPLGRGPSPQEVYDAVRFILAAPALTGQMIALDGGQHLGWAVPSGPEPEE